MGDEYLLTGGKEHMIEFTPNTWIYSWSTGNWTPLTDQDQTPHRTLANHCLKVTLNDRDYVVIPAGTVPDPEIGFGAITGATSVFDVQERVWLDNADDLPVPMKQIGTVLVNGEMYTLGGRLDNGDPSDKVFKLVESGGRFAWEEQTFRLPVPTQSITGFVHNTVE